VNDSVGRALRISAVSLAWTLVASAGSIGIGAATGTLVLVTFGLVSLLDAAGSLTLVVHFRHAQHTGDMSERHEAIALRVITIGLVVLGLVTVAQSVHRLTTHAEPDAAPVGLAIAAASALVLAALAPRKRRIGKVVGSHALRADGVVSGIGAVLAVITLVGAGVTTAAGWWWLDPLAAVGVASGAVAAGIALARG